MEFIIAGLVVGFIFCILGGVALGQGEGIGAVFLLVAVFILMVCIVEGHHEVRERGLQEMMEKSISSAVVSGEVDQSFLDRVQMKITNVEEKMEGHFVTIQSEVEETEVTFHVSKQVAEQMQKLVDESGSKQSGE